MKAMPQMKPATRRNACVPVAIGLALPIAAAA
jgi:hypothetical protein